MSTSKQETKQAIEQIIFGDSVPREWSLDVWDLNPVLGEKAVRILDVFEKLVDYCPEDKLEMLKHEIEDY